MRRSPIMIAALVALLTGLAGAACSKKDAQEPKAPEAEVAAPDVSEGDASATSEKAKSEQATLAEKARARQAARKAAAEAKKAASAKAAATPSQDEAPPAIDTNDGAPLPPPTATGAALVARNDTPTPTATRPSPAGAATPEAAPEPTPPEPVAPAPVAPAPASPGPGVEIIVRDDVPLDLSKVVTLADVQKVMKKGALRESEPLAGSLAARDYNGVRFFASQNETLGATVQLWRFPTTIDARRRYDLYSSRYPNAEKTDAVATQGFFAQSGDVLYLGFLDQPKKAVVIVSCSEDACDMKDLYVLARDLQKKL